MTTATPLNPPGFRYTYSDGTPLAGGLVYCYTAGTSSPKDTYTDSTAGTANANPVVLDSYGAASIYITGSCKFIVKDSAGNTIDTKDVVPSYVAGIARTITGGGGITVTNGDGVSGNPTLSISNLKTIWVPAKSIIPSATGGCAALATIATSANKPDITSLDFDATTAEYAQFLISMPKSWYINNSTVIYASFVWSHAAATAYNVVWGLQAVLLGDDQAIATAYGTAQTVTDAGGTTSNQYLSALTSGITVSGTFGDTTANRIAQFRVYRDATNVADTLDVDARLHGVRIFYTANTLDDT